MSRPYRVLAISLLCLLTLAMFGSYLALRLQAVHDFLARIEANQQRIIEHIDRTDEHTVVYKAMLERNRAHMFAQDKTLEDIRRVIVGNP
jgi:hypothetical protein